MLTETLVVGGGITFTGAALAVAILQSKGQSDFLYANSRIVARNSLVLDKKRMEPLVSCKHLSELINQLKDTEYYPFLESIDKDSTKEFNIALEKGLISSLRDIQKVAPKKFQKVFDVYIKFYESKMIKTFFRSRFSKIHIDEKLLEPIGTINPVLLKHLHDSKTIADMKIVLRDTSYGPLFEKEYTSIEDFDLAIENKVMKDIDETLLGMKIFDRRAIMDIFSKRREIKNILMLLKFRIRSVPKERQKELVELKNIDEDLLIDSESLDEFVKHFTGTEYEEVLLEALSQYKKEQNYYSFEKMLLGHYYNFVVSNDLLHTLGPYPIISYFTKKEIEQKNLLIVSKGIKGQLDKKEIEEMLI